MSNGQEYDLFSALDGKKAKRVDELVSLITKYNEQYYNKNASDISDEQYDALKDELKDLDPENSLLKTVGVAAVSEWKKVAHVIPMGSLNKVNTEEEFLAWAKETKAGSFMTQDKCDGISLELIYRQGSLLHAITRGDGQIGEDITNNVVRMQNVHKTLKTGFSGSLRGEIVITHEDFKKHYEGKMANPRNAASGIAKRYDGQGAEHLTVIYYNCIPQADSGLKFKTEFDKLAYIGTHLSLRPVPSYETDLAGVLAIYNAYQFRRTHKDNPVEQAKAAVFYVLKSLGVEATPEKLLVLATALLGGKPKAVENAVAELTPKVIENFLKKFEIFRQFGESTNYDHDGLVIKVNDLELQDDLGDVNGNPRGQIAFKFAHEMRVSKVTRIAWQVGNTGRVTPVVYVEPVKLAGAMVQKASLYNMDYIEKIGVAEGDEVMVARANDVIPRIESVVKHVGKKIEAPQNCPVCKTKLIKEQSGDEEGVHLLCPNEDCFARLTGNLSKWITTLEIDEIGDKFIEVLVNRKLVEDVADLYKLKPADIVALEGKGDKSAKKILDNLHAKKELPVPTFLGGLNISGCGTERFEALVKAGYDTLEKIQALTVPQIADIPGMGTKSATAIYQGLKKKEVLIGKLLKHVKLVDPKPKKSEKLKGLSFCFTGEMTHTREDLEQMVEENSGEVKGVSGKLTYLVQADPSSESSKSVKAKKLGTKIISEKAFLEMIGDL